MPRHLIVAVMAAILASTATLRAEDIFVDQLDISKAAQAVTAAKPIGTMAGKKYEHALTLKPNGSLVIDLKSAAKSFSTTVGLDDLGNDDAMARFYIFGDGKLLAESGIMNRAAKTKALTADLTGVKQLVLRVDDVASKNISTLATFDQAKITMDAAAKDKPVTVAASEALPEQVVFVDQLDVTKATTGWNEPQINRSAEYHPVTLKGKTFLHAFGTHANSIFVIDLKGAAKSFSAIAGIDDDAEEGGSCGFTVIGDGKVLAKTGTITRTEPVKPITVDLTGIQQLVLQVDSGDDDSIDNDHSDWADAKIVLDPAKAKDRPEAVNSTQAKLPK